MLTRDFILAGKAIFTVSNRVGERYTFRVTHKEGSARYQETWFVALLTGPDNTTSYTYMGMLSPNDGAVHLTRNSRFNDESKPVRVIRWVLEIVWNGGELPAGYKLQHEGRCGKCGRMLTVPESIESGIGPECAKRLALV